MTAVLPEAECVWGCDTDCGWGCLGVPCDRHEPVATAWQRQAAYCAGAAGQLCPAQAGDQQNVARRGSPLGHSFGLRAFRARLAMLFKTLCGGL
jgi:hypothetical protein